MTRLLYLANIRIPTEKAHGLQIMQNCEAFADAGADVTLWVAARWNARDMQAISNPWDYYGVRANFQLRRVPCLDLLPLVPERTDALARVIFYIQQTTFILAAVIGTLFTRADIIYSREPLLLLALSWFKPRRALAYEAHQRRVSRVGRWLQAQTVRRVGTVIAVTERLKTDLTALAAGVPTQFMVAHDGIRRERFAAVPAQAEARRHLGWPEAAFIVGYVGRLHTMTMDKGVGTLVEALAQIENVYLALVGGPDDMAATLRDQWQQLGLPADHFLYAGQVTPERVPLYLSAFDVCAMPFPWTEHFAYYASPIKLFEYMAARRPIVASDLPSTAEVVKNNETALLYAPGNVQALALALARLYAAPELRQRLADQAYEQVMAHYTWAARAQAILQQIGSPAR